MNSSRLIIGLIIITFGFSLLLDLPIFKYVFPVVIIITGLRILFGKPFSFQETRTPSKEDKIDRVLIFSGINQKVISDNFTGAEIVAVFGGGELDLSQVKTVKKELKLSFVAVFGGLKVYIPKNWTVKSTGVGIIGGFSNNTNSNIKTNATAVIEGVAIFGGVELVN